MNDKYFETKDNNYILIDDNKNISLIKSNNDIKEILNLENKLENELNKLNKIKIDLNIISTNKKSKKTFNKFIFVVESLIIIAGSLTATISASLLFALFVFVLLKSNEITLFKTKNQNDNDEKILLLNKQLVLDNIKDLEIKLQNKKTESNYKKETLIDIIEKDYSIEQKEADNKENNKVKKLVLKNKPN